MSLIEAQFKDASISEPYKKELYLLKAGLHLDDGDKNSAHKCFSVLAQLEPEKTTHLMNMSITAEDFEKKYYT